MIIDVNPLIAAIDSALTAAGIPFGDSNRPSDVIVNRPYVVAFTDSGRVTDRTMLSRDGLLLSMVFHTYAWSPDSVRIGRRTTLSTIFGLAGTTSGGWHVHTPVHVAALALERDDKVNPPLFWQTDDFTIRLTPA